MALPVGVTTATVTFGKDVDLLGDNASVKLKITPSHTLVWAATGERITPFDVESVAAEGVTGAFNVPHVDQAGFVDRAGNAITNWYYTVQGTVTRGRSTIPYRKVFQVLTGTSTLDLDLIEEDGTVGAVGIAPVPAVTSVNGQTGAVVLPEGISAEDIAGQVEDPETPIGASVETAVLATATPVYATHVGARVASGIVAIGDSITSYNSVGGDVWHKVLATASNGRLRHRGFFATGGHTLAQIEADHLPSVLAMNPRPGACIIAGGTNDVGDGGFSESASRATLLRMITTLQNNGILPVLWTLPPREDGGDTVNNRLQRWNPWVRLLAQSMGLPIIDAHATLTESTTGNYVFAYRGDNVHPNQMGHYAIGTTAAANTALLNRFADSTPPLTMSIRDSFNMIPSGRGLFTAVNGSQVPTGWSSYGSGSYVRSMVTDTNVPGNWIRITKPDGVASGSGLQYDVTTGFSPGDRIGFAVRFRSSTPGVGQISVSVQARSSGTTIRSGIGYATYSIANGIVWCEADVRTDLTPVDTIRFVIALSGDAAGEAVADFAQATGLNLTSLGIG